MHRSLASLTRDVLRSVELLRHHYSVSTMLLALMRCSPVGHQEFEETWRDVVVAPVVVVAQKLFNSWDMLSSLIVHREIAVFTALVVKRQFPDASWTEAPFSGGRDVGFGLWFSLCHFILLDDLQMTRTRRMMAAHVAIDFIRVFAGAVSGFDVHILTTRTTL